MGNQIISEMRRGQNLELQVLEACKEGRVSQGELQSKRYTGTFGHLRARYCSKTSNSQRLSILKRQEKGEIYG